MRILGILILEILENFQNCKIARKKTRTILRSEISQNSENNNS